MRKIEFDFTVMSFADTAARLDKVELGKTLDMKGFIAQRSLRSSKLTVHITEFKIRS
jgi:primosomal replication protein N